MLIFWQECKYILRSRFLWIVVILGSIFAVYYNTNVAANLGSDISFSYEFTEQHGLSFKEKDVEEFLDILLEQHYRAQDLKSELKAAGIPKVTAKDIIDSAMGNDCEFTNQLMQIANTDDKAYGEIINDLYPFEWIARGALSRNVEEYDVVERGKSLLESMENPLSSWKQEMLLDAFGKLQKRTEEITQNQENQYFLPYSFGYSDNSGWFSAQFSGFSALGFIWGFSMVLAGIIAARSIGGSFLNHMSGTLYCGKAGRKLALRKIVSVLAISGMLFLALSLLTTIYYVYRFRLNLYWDVPLASMIQHTGPLIPHYNWRLLVVPTGRGACYDTDHGADFLGSYDFHQEFLCWFCHIGGGFAPAVGACPDGARCAKLVFAYGKPYWLIFTSRQVFAGAISLFHSTPL